MTHYSRFKSQSLSFSNLTYFHKSLTQLIKVRMYTIHYLRILASIMLGRIRLPYPFSRPLAGRSRTQTHIDIMRVVLELINILDLLWVVLELIDDLDLLRVVLELLNILDHLQVVLELIHNLDILRVVLEFIHILNLLRVVLEFKHIRPLRGSL